MIYGEVSLKAGRWIVSCEPHVMIRLKRLFSGVNPRQFDAAELTDTLENCRELLWFLQRFPMRVPELSYLTARAKKHEEQETTIHQIQLGDYQPQEFQLALPPRHYQAVAAELNLRMGGLLVADDVGLGKSCTAICLLTNPQALPALVVTLTHLPMQWQMEIFKFAPNLRTTILKKGTPYDLTKMRRKTVPFPDVIITNYHKLSGWAHTLAPIVNCVIYDEIQELRHGDASLKGAAAYHLSQNTRFRCGLSATPIYNYGGEIFNVLHATNPGTLGTSAEFYREWCDAYSQKKLIKHPKVFGRYLREQGLMIRRTRTDVQRELPDLLKIPHQIDCDQKAFDEIKGRATELAKLILSESPLKKGERFKASEELSWRVRQATGIAKAPYVAAFVRLLVESGEPVLLYGWHRSCYDLWKELLADLNPAMYTGTESPNQKQKARDAFVNGDTDLLCMSLRSGAGVEGLQARCRTVVFGELDWSPGVHHQAIGRIHRDGQNEKVAAYFLLADSGSDPVVAGVLGIKTSQSEGLRDPDKELIEKLEVSPDNVRQLASTYLQQQGEKVKLGYTVTGTAQGKLEVRMTGPLLEEATTTLNGPLDLIRINVEHFTPHLCGLSSRVSQLFPSSLVVTVSADPYTPHMMQEVLGYSQIFSLEDSTNRVIGWAQSPDLILVEKPTACKTVWRDLLTSGLIQTCLEVLPKDTGFVEEVLANQLSVVVITDDKKYQTFADRLATGEAP